LKIFSNPSCVKNSPATGVSVGFTFHSSFSKNPFQISQPVIHLERAMNFVPWNIADKKGWTKVKLVLEEGIAAAKTTGGAAARPSPFLAATSSPVARATPPVPSPSETSACPSASRPAGIFTTTSLAAKAGLLNKKVSEQDMNQAVTEFLAESGSAPAIVALPSFQRLLDCWSHVPGHKVPPPRQFSMYQGELGKHV